MIYLIVYMKKLLLKIYRFLLEQTQVTPYKRKKKLSTAD